LAGIPLVSAAWITACKDQKQIIIPSGDMFVRTLPVSKKQAGRSQADFGLARSAAYAQYRTNHTLRRCTVQLCGSFSRPLRNDIQLLLREAGATQSLQISSTIASLRGLDVAAADNVVVLLCDDTSAISEALTRQVKATLENHANRVYVVNPQWLFDSVSAGSAIQPDDYEPQSAKSKALWKLQQEHLAR
jgi:polynucleotide 5'-kinase involved in rRNA processing